jgi:hypothetical protein
MSSQTFTASGEGGKLKFADQKRLDQFLLANQGPLYVTVGRQQRIRSGKQNRYFYSVIVNEMCDRTGFTPEELKQVLKREFGLLKTIEYNGKNIEVLKSTAELSTSEFEDFMSKCRMFAAREFQIILPEPNEEISDS